MTIDSISFIHHSRTDLCYTHDQPILFSLEEHFISEAVRLTDKYADTLTDGVFLWAVETTYVLKQWLAYAHQSEIHRFIALDESSPLERPEYWPTIRPSLAALAATSARFWMC